MRLYCLSDSTLPSTDANAVQVMRMAQAFARVGATVTLVARRGAESSSSTRLFPDYGVEPVFRLQRLPFFPLRGMTRAYGLGAALLAWIGRADAAYCRCLQSAHTAARLGLPVFYELHSLPPVGGPTDRRWLPSLLANPNCRGVIAITNLLREDLVARYNVPRGRVIVAPDGADAPWAAISPILPQTGRLRVGFTGQLDSGKGMEIILSLAQACSWADFHVVGGREPELGNWRGLADGLPNLTFHGYVKPAAVAGYIASFDVVLLPNQREVLSSGGGEIGRWTSPLKLFEYMAAGKPILASDLSVLREVLQSGVNALLCNPDNPRAWSDALQRLKDNSKLRAALGTAAQRDFQAGYSWDSRAQRLLDQVRISTARNSPNTNPLPCCEPMCANVHDRAKNAKRAVHFPLPPSS